VVLPTPLNGRVWIYDQYARTTPPPLAPARLATGRLARPGSCAHKKKPRGGKGSDTGQRPRAGLGGVMGARTGGYAFRRTHT
jgi:hypothetical protein